MFKINNKDIGVTSVNELKDLIFLSKLQIFIKCSKNAGRRTLNMLITRDFLDTTEKCYYAKKHNVFKFIISLSPTLLLGRFKRK